MEDIQIAAELAQKIENLASMADHLPGVIVVHDIRDQTIRWMSERGLKNINATADEIIGKKLDVLHDRNFNPSEDKDYVTKIIELLERNNDEEIITFFEQVEVQGSEDWTWHMSSVKIFQRDASGKPIMIISISIPIDSMHHMAAKATRLSEENNFLRENYHLFANLSEREKEILKLLALGKSAPETAALLYIAPATVESHRKNIRLKLKTSSYYVLCQYARAFDLI